MVARNTQFEIEISDDGSIRLAGEAAVPVLLRLVLAAKFQTELNAEHLLSPHVDRMLDELTSVSPIPPIEWHNPAIRRPPQLRKAVEVVRRYRDLHEREQDLNALLQLAFKPYGVPPEWLDLPPSGRGPTAA